MRGSGEQRHTRGGETAHAPQRTAHEAGTFTRAGRARSRDTEKRIGLSGPSGGGQAGLGQGRPSLCPPQARKNCVVRCVKQGAFIGAFLVFGLCCSVFAKSEQETLTAAQCAGSGCVTM